MIDRQNLFDEPVNNGMWTYDITIEWLNITI